MTHGPQPQTVTDAGFTLLEMIATLAIIALTAAVVVPRVAASRQHISLRSTAVELASSLKMARSAALRSNSDRILILDTARRRYAAAGAVPSRPIAREIGIRFEAKAADSLGPTMGGFRFRPDGSASGGSIRLASGHETATIAVDWMTGAVTLKSR